MKKRFIILLIILIYGIMQKEQLLSQNRKADYLNYIKKAAEEGLKEYPVIIEKWKKDQLTSHILWGYDAPGHPVYLADILGFLYKETKEEKYAESAIDILNSYGDLRKSFSKDAAKNRIEYKNGVPSLSNFFYLPTYCRAFQRIRDSKYLTNQKKKKIEDELAFSVDFLFHFPEWGTHNRAMLRAWSLMNAYITIPDYPGAENWKKMAEIIANDNLTQWEVEDASVYHPVWLYALFNYAEITGNDSLFDSPIIKYYMDYHLNLITPNGNYVDFGDGVWKNGWDRLIPVYEKAAARYKNPQYKYIAKMLLENAYNTKRAADKVASKNRPHDVLSYGVVAASAFTDAYYWTDENIQPQKPGTLSLEVMDDLIGKKIVFKNGWDNSSTYMLFNYQDEGQSGYIHKYYLKNTITVEEEKTHHGHSDEQNICFLSSDSSILLHDGGYRSGLPSGKWGAYRADYFHNRIIGRKNRMDKGQDVFEFIRNSGAYRNVKTQKIDFLKMKSIDMCRTRLTDEQTGFSNDRVITYFKEKDFFIVIDIVKALQNDFFTFTNIWHTQSILKKDTCYFDTRYNKIINEEFPKNKSLLIYFPENEIKQIGSYEEDRHSQKEYAIHQTATGNYHQGDIETFVTVLYPHNSNDKVDSIIKKIKVIECGKNGICLEIKEGKITEFLFIKLDIESEIVKENIRPRYTWESGKVKFGDFETDAHFMHAKLGNKLEFSASNMLKVMYKNKPVMEAWPNNHGLQPNGSKDRNTISKWRMWEDAIELKNAK